MKKIIVQVNSYAFSFCMGLFAINSFAESYQQDAIQAPLASQSLILDITQVNDKLVVVGERGHILISSDNATSWQQKPVPTQSNLTAIFFIDSNTGWAVGHDAVIIKTNDAGETWQRIYAASDEQLPLLDIWFKDRENGIALGAYGYYLETDDGGLNWTQRFIGEDDFHLNKLIAKGEDCLFIAAEAGYAYHSSNGGKDWKLIETPYHGSFFSVHTDDCKTIYLGGLRGNLYKSTDAGANWQKVEVNTNAMLTSIYKSDTGGLWITGLDGVLLRESKDDVFELIDTGNRFGNLALIELTNGELVFASDSGIHKLTPKITKSE